MQLLAVFAAAAVIHSVVAIQPVIPELQKKSPHRHSRGWRWRNYYGHSDGGEPISSSIATPTIMDPETFTSTAVSYTIEAIEALLGSRSAIASGLPLSSAVRYPNMTTIPANSSVTTSYHSYIAHTYTYPNATSVSNYSWSTGRAMLSTTRTAAPFPNITSTIPANSSVATSYYSNIAHTYTYPNATLASNYSWSTGRAMLSATRPVAPFPNITYTFNASAILNFTTFRASPYHPSTVLSAILGSITTSPSPLPPSPASSTALLSATPIFIAPTSALLHPNTTISQTTTVVQGEATGLPDPTAFHCGVHGLPIGLYKIAEYWERAGTDVTLEGCWEFCEAASEACFSYSFYREAGLDDARCDLFGGSVADSLDSIIQEVPRVWYDLGCGNPLLLK